MKYFLKTKFLYIVMFCSLLAGVMGCSKHESLYNVPDQMVQTTKITHTADEVKIAILRAGLAKGWQMFSENAGSIAGTLNIRSHTAIVEITYDENRYSITYKDSNNLKYYVANAHIKEEKFIHKNYNVWIRELDRAIKSQLLAL